MNTLYYVEADSLEWRTKTLGTRAGAAKTYHALLLEGDKVSDTLQAFYGFIGTNQMMAYLSARHCAQPRLN